MEEKNQTEEVQSRREFFKKTARIALPLIGGIIIGSSPSIYKKAVTKVATGCDGCSGSCDGGCAVGCRGGCHSGSE